MKPQDRARHLRPYIEEAAAALPDEDALEAVELFPAWAAGVAYALDDRVQDGGILYRCAQPHTSQADWRPALTPALWVVVSVEEWPEWVQPTAAHDAYAKGAKVSHNDRHWFSDIDANVYEPGVYGWTEVTT